MIGNAGAAVVVLLGLAAVANADTLRGRVVDLHDAPLAGATVIAEGPALIGQQTEITDDDGMYVLTLPTGTYRVVVYYAESQRRRDHVVVAPTEPAVVNVAIDLEADQTEVIHIDIDRRCCCGESCRPRTAGLVLDKRYLTQIPAPSPPPPLSPRPQSHGCGHCATGGGDASGLLVLATLGLRRRRPAR